MSNKNYHLVNYLNCSYINNVSRIIRENRLTNNKNVIVFLYNLLYYTILYFNYNYIYNR